MNLFLPMLGVGLVTSVHCVAMCGSMVLTYAVKGDQEGPWLRRMLPHFAYHVSKLTSYVLVGLLLGSVGQFLNGNGVRGGITVFAGVFMMLMALNMTGKFPALRRLQFRPPKFLMQALSKTRRKANADEAEGRQSVATPITFGLLTGLMPCGPLQGAQLAAAGAGSMLGGASAMLGFGLGTMPLMLGFGAVSGFLGAKFKSRMMLVSAAVVFILGGVMLNRGAMLLGSPVTFQTIKQTVVGTPQVADSSFKTGADGVVEVPLVIENVRFAPQALAIPAGKPVRLIVDRREDNACSAQLAIPQLGVLANLKNNGTTIVDVPASKAGNYTLTCGMGMMAGQISVGGGAASPNRMPLLLGLGALAGLGYSVLRKRTAEQAPVAHGGAKGTGGGSAPKAGGNGRAGHRPGPQPVPQPAGVFGFAPAELLVVTTSLVVAIILGLSFGGLL